MIDDALVSVVVPVYNRAEFVCDAVRSVLDQTHRRVECVIVDDGSTDATLDAVRDAFAEEERVRILSVDHGGVSAARNHGLAHARGRYVTFLDSDDTMVPARIELQLAPIADGAADSSIGRQEQVLVGVSARPRWLEAQPEQWNGLYHTSILAETSRVRDIGGFDERLEFGEDIELVARLAGAGVRIAHVDEVVVRRRYHGGNVTYGMTDADHGATFRSVRNHLLRRRDPDARTDADAAFEVAQVKRTLDRASRVWEELRARGAVTSRELSIAEIDVEIAVAGDGLAAMLLAPFDGLPPAKGAVAATVGAWDFSSTGSGFPLRPPIGPPGPYRCTIRRDGHPIAETQWSSPDVFRSADRTTGQQFLAVRHPSALSPREGAAPLRRLLTWALGPDVLFVHAGAVGTDAGVALLMGASGAGKSSTSLACLRAGMGFIGDDYCVVRGDPPVAHQLYGTARLCDHDVMRFGDLLQPAVAASEDDAELESDMKALYLLAPTHADRMLASAPVRTVIVPAPSGTERPRLEPMTAGEVLRAVAPAALWQLNVDPGRELRALRHLLERVPCFRLALSEDRDANPPIIRDALDRLDAQPR